MIFGYGKLKRIYELNFQLCFHHGFSLSEITNMVPWERYMLIDMVAAEMEAEAERRRDKRLGTIR
jgi:hypothetical protein